MFTRSAISPPKVNRFRWNLENSEYIVGGWPWQISGEICAVATAWKPGDFLSGTYKSNARFPIGRISRNLNTTRRSVSRWELSEQNFEYFTIRGLFSKTLKFLNFYVLRLQVFIDSAIITDRRKFTTKITLYGISSLHYYRLDQFKVIPSGLYTPYKKPHQIFFNVRRGLTTRQITLTSLSLRQPITIDYWVTWHQASSNARSKQLVHRLPSASSRILYCGHSTQNSHLVFFIDFCDWPT